MIMCAASVVYAVLDQHHTKFKTSVSTLFFIWTKWQKQKHTSIVVVLTFSNVWELWICAGPGRPLLGGGGKGTWRKTQSALANRRVENPREVFQFPYVITVTFFFPVRTSLGDAFATINGFVIRMLNIPLYSTCWIELRFLFSRILHRKQAFKVSGRK